MPRIKKKHNYPTVYIEPEELFAPKYKTEENGVADLSKEKVDEITNMYFVGDRAVGNRNEVRKLLEEHVIGNIGEKGKLLTDKLFELVEGIWQISSIQNVNGFEKVKAYRQPPNLNAIIYALDRVLGKPKQIEVKATFSLSKLLKGEINDGPLGLSNNAEDEEESAVLHQDDVGFGTAAG